jgi:hypothetical protein
MIFYRKVFFLIVILFFWFDIIYSIGFYYISVKEISFISNYSNTSRVLLFYFF